MTVGIVFGIFFSGNYIDICFIPRNMKPEEAYQCCLQAMQILPVLSSLLHCCLSLFFLSHTYTHSPSCLNVGTLWTLKSGHSKNGDGTLNLCLSKGLWCFTFLTSLTVVFVPHFLSDHECKLNLCNISPPRRRISIDLWTCLFQYFGPVC